MSFAPPAGAPEGDASLELNETKIMVVKKFDPALQAIRLPEKLNQPGPWQVVRRRDYANELVSRFPAPRDNILTCYDILEDSIARFPDRPYLGTRARRPPPQLGPYEWISYKDFGALRTQVGAGLRSFGVSQGARVGICARNCFDWALVDTAAMAYGMTVVPLYDTLGPDAVEFIARHAEVEAIAAAPEQIGRVLEVLPRTPTVKLVVAIATEPGARLPVLPPGTPEGVQVVSVEKLRAAGAANPLPHAPPAPQDMAIINYTSGTTGDPKGVIVTHANAVAAGAALKYDLIDALGGDPSDIEYSHLSYLPLAHIYERLLFGGATHLGGKIGFYNGDVLRIGEDLEELRPTSFSSVPRLYNRIYDRVLAELDAKTPIARALFWRAFRYKLEHYQKGDMHCGKWAPFWDRLIFSKVQKKLGGNLMLVSSGSAPLSKEVFDFLVVSTSATVVEGYGMTETASLISVMVPGDPVVGHVGFPVACTEIKLESVPEMGYSTDDKPYPRGEICVRGPNIFSGYYKDPAATAEAFDAEGWFHTGDIGSFIQDDRLKIIDRKKNIFKLSQGEYIAPEKIENVYTRSPFVLQAFVYGDSFQSQLVAVVVPDPDQLLPWAKQRGLRAPNGVEDLVKDPKVAQAILRSIQEEGRTAGLKGFEQVAAIRLVAEEFTPENGILTSTFKLKRNVAKERFQTDIDDLYARLNGRK